MSIYRVDLHLHTAASPDGRSSLEGIAKAAKAAGLDAIAVTDHDLCTPVPAALDGVLLIPGCEVSTAAGHITGLFLERPLPLEALGHLPAPEAAVEAIREAGGLAVLAHPYQRPGAAPEQFTFPLDAVEAVNARACFKVPEANEKAAAGAKARPPRCGRQRRPRRRRGRQCLYRAGGGGAGRFRPAGGSGGGQEPGGAPAEHVPFPQGAVPVDQGPAGRGPPPAGEGGAVPGLLRGAGCSAACWKIIGGTYGRDRDAGI